MDAHLGYRRSLDTFDGSINSVTIANVDDDVDRETAIEECEVAWAGHRDDLARLKDYFSADTASVAGYVSNVMHSYANYAVDGLIPSTHAGRTEPDWDGMAEALEKLHDLISAELDMEPSEIEEFLSGSGRRLGGTGLRY